MELKVGEIVRGYIQFGEWKGNEVIREAGFIIDERGRMYGVWNGKEMIPARTLEEAKRISKRISRRGKPKGGGRK